MVRIDGFIKEKIMANDHDRDLWAGGAGGTREIRAYTEGGVREK